MTGLRTVLLSVHVAAGVAGLILGVFAISPAGQQWVRRGYAAALVVLTVFLTALVAVDWPNLATTQRGIFSALVALAVFIVIRGLLALRVARRRPADWEPKYINHIYFTYVSLWEAFFIVGLIDLGAPAWLIAAVAIGVVIIGAFLVSRYRRRLVRPRAESA